MVRLLVMFGVIWLATALLAAPVIGRRLKQVREAGMTAEEKWRWDLEIPDRPERGAGTSSPT